MNEPTLDPMLTSPGAHQRPRQSGRARSLRAAFATGALVALGACQQHCSRAPEKLVTPVFREDRPPAVANPSPEDRDWKPRWYDPLVPSNPDGKPTFSNYWFNRNIPVWSEVLGPLRGKPNLRYLEIGVFEGRSVIWAFENILTHPSSTAVAIDLFNTAGLEERFRENLRRAGVDKRTEVLAGYSNEKLRGLPPDSFDVVYIDGSHAAHDVLRDGVLAWDLLKMDGILIFDDYLYNLHFPLELRPQVAINSLITAFHNQIRVLKLGQQAVFQKVKDPCPGMCTRVGPYEFHWDDDPAAGMLYDPRTKARVPLTASELDLLQKVLASRSFGMTGIQAEEALVNGRQFTRLRERLGI